MNTCKDHKNHDHKHNDGCGHTAVRHEGHTDFLHDGHLHHPHNGHYDEHTIEVSNKNPKACTSGHPCSSHDSKHKHGPGCGHDSVPHGDHLDFLVGGHLHHWHNGHCDNHGDVATA
jgi:hypothetical protein